MTMTRQKESELAAKERLEDILAAATIALTEVGTIET